MQAPPWCLVRGRELVRGRHKGAQFTSSSSVLSEGTPFMFDVYIEELETTRSKRPCWGWGCRGRGQLLLIRWSGEEPGAEVRHGEVSKRERDVD